MTTANMSNSLMNVKVTPNVTILCLALTVFFGSVLGSSIESPKCASFSLLPDRETATKRINDMLEDGNDIIEVHFKTNATFDFTEDESEMNKTLDEADAIEQYNTSIYFIVTQIGKSIMKYPVDADVLSLGILGSKKGQLSFDVEFDSYDVSPEQFRECCLQKLKMNSTVRQSETSICYFQIPNLGEALWFIVPLPYFTYNTFKTVCISHEDMEKELPQALSNKLLWWFFFFFFVTFPLGFSFIPHSIHQDTTTYRRADIPYSVSMFLSYILYGSHCSCSCKCMHAVCCYSPNKGSNEDCSGSRNGSNIQNTGIHSNGGNKNSHVNSKTMNKRVLCLIGLFIYLGGGGIQMCFYFKNPLENNLASLTDSGSNIGSELGLILTLIINIPIIIYFPVTLLLYKILMHDECDHVYPIYIISLRKCCSRVSKDNKKTCCFCLYNVNGGLKIDVNEPQFSVKMISEVHFGLWRKAFKEGGILLLLLNIPLIILCSIPFINILIRVFKQGIKGCIEICLAIGFTFLYILSIFGVNMLLLKPLTLLFQCLFMTIFVGIPIYPRYIGYVILFTAGIKFYSQEFVAYQSKLKCILDSIFAYPKRNKIINDDDPKDVIPKKLFSNVHKQCLSVNAYTPLTKLVLFSIVGYTAFQALEFGILDTDKWGSVIPPMVLLIAPDFLSKFLYNEDADKKYIEDCVDQTLCKFKSDSTFKDFETYCKHVMKRIGEAKKENEHEERCQYCNGTIDSYEMECPSTSRDQGERSPLVAGNSSAPQYV